MQKLTGMLLSSVLVLGPAGCGAGGDDIYLSDSVDLALDFNLLGGPSDQLHSPYVQGARFFIYVHSTDERSMAGWTLSSDRQDVLRVVSEEVVPLDENDSLLRAEVIAEGEGTATVVARDQRGLEVASELVEVRMPDRVELLSYGPLLIGQSQNEAAVDELRILEGGTATFLMRYFREGRQLHGHGTLSTLGTETVSAEPRQTFLFEDRDWLTVTPAVAGESSVALQVAGTTIREVPVVAVSPDAIAYVTIEGTSEAGAHADQSMVLFARAWDDRGRPIFGVQYSWEVEGQFQPEAGDLFRYNYAPGTELEVGAQFGDLEARVLVHAEGGYVDSTNNVGCSATGARSAGATLGLVLAAMLLVMRRRRA